MAFPSHLVGIDKATAKKEGVASLHQQFLVQRQLAYYVGDAFDDFLIGLFRNRAERVTAS